MTLKIRMSNYFGSLKTRQNKVNFSYIRKKEFRLFECQKVISSQEDLWTLEKCSVLLLKYALRKELTTTFLR